MKIRLFLLTFMFMLILCGCTKKEEVDVENIEIDLPLVAVNEKPDRTEVEEVYDWVSCPTSAKKVGSEFVFSSGEFIYKTSDLKVGQTIYEVIKYPNMTAEIQVKPTTVTNQVEYEILDYRFYDNGNLIYKKTLEDVWSYYKETYNIPTVGDTFSGVYQLTNLRECTTYNKENYLEMTFTDENFNTFICRDYSKESKIFIGQDDISKWYTIKYRVDSGLNYSENKTDYYYTIVEIKEY